MSEKITSVIVKDIYPIVKTAMDKNKTKYKKYLKDFFEKRSEELYDIVPCNRIFYGADDVKEYFKSIGINDKDILSHIKNTFYYNMNFNPRSMKMPLTVTQMMVIRYYLLNNNNLDAEISSIYLAFSGQFYPSIHSQKFKYIPQRHIMEYIVNNELSQKFDLKREGSVFGAVKSICKTWLNTYGEHLMDDDIDDKEISILVEQLHGRIKSFLGNIASVFYKVYEEGTYMSYDSDADSEDDFRLLTNDSIKAEQYVENTMNYILTNTVNYAVCKKASDSNVKATELRSIIESIQDDTANIPVIKELVRILICEYLASNPKDRTVTGTEFAVFAMSPKPNSKNKNIIRQKEIIEGWLDENSPQYRKRKSREATKSSYHKSVTKYYVLVINIANK